LRIETRKIAQAAAKEQKATDRVQMREDRRAEIARTRLSKARQLAEKRLTEARAQLDHQMAALERVNEAVIFSMDDTYNADMLHDAILDVVVEEVEEIEESEEIIEEEPENILRFGTKELDRYVPLD